MCGLIAVFSRRGAAPLSDESLRAAVTTLANRGPDGEAVLARGPFALGHRRLSIIDVEGGTQPVYNETGELAGILNGEIYNHEELRRELEAAGHRYRTRSDTESLVHLFEQHGLEGVRRTVGMFAYVIADFAARRMVVYRDRLGEKPLYYIDHPDRFACASEIKALQALPGFDDTIDPEALAAYLRLGWVPGPGTIHAHVRQLPPGCWLVVDETGTNLQRYWSPVLAPPGAAFDRRTAVAELESLLMDTMANKLVSDVPVGVLLSGGLDSSAVVAAASRHSATPLRTFSVGFAAEIDERPAARMVAERYGTDHTEILIEDVSPDDLMAASACLDQPFGDSSAVPTLALARETRKQIKVVLTGDGGDELFGGYESYLRQRRQTRNPWLRKSVGLAATLAARLRWPDPVTRLYPLPDAADGRLEWLVQRSFLQPEEVGALLGRPAAEAEAALVRQCWPAGGPDDPLSTAFQFDLGQYLPEDLLRKVDRMAMCVGLESRSPFLDHRLVEFALRIPPAEKLDGPTTKSLLREALRPHLPAAILERRKQGFGAPLVGWLEGSFAGSARALLLEESRCGRLLDRAALDRLVRRSFDTLRSDWRSPHRIWVLLMLELWLRKPNRAG